MRMFGSSQKLLGRALLYPALLTQMLIPRSEPAAPTSPSSRRPALPAYLSAGKVPYGPLHIGWQGLASSGCALLCLHFLGHDVLLHGEDGLSKFGFSQALQLAANDWSKDLQFYSGGTKGFQWRLTICPIVVTFTKLLGFPIAVSNPRLW